MVQLDLFPGIHWHLTRQNLEDELALMLEEDRILTRLNIAMGGNMSTTPGLTKHQLFQSHLVNCQICQRYPDAKVVEIDKGRYDVETGKKSSYTGKKRHQLCPVGVKLLAEALAEDNTKNPFKPTHFPFVPKMHEKVLAHNIKTNEWIEGKVIDKSLSATGQPMGYEIEVREGERFYANRFNVRRLKRHGVSKSMDNGSQEGKGSNSDEAPLRQNRTSGGLRMFRVRGNTAREQTITQPQVSPTKGRRFVVK